jgi:hypothetical protein
MNEQFLRQRMGRFLRGGPVHNPSDEFGADVFWHRFIALMKRLLIEAVARLQLRLIDRSHVGVLL